ncbi:Succinate-semialdehyde dehydrogenase [Niveomyces insectorum RCEF 264]|uniref:Succinate-semialdehyde dehydrogenase n=1 Tax=Niveomyces insectorum RCEF 264 TaxID=1081102 RepID=A0A167Z1B1_9HYPO|nr:Succinate-semialdehyde dehydrogenase [Niveomyces insectorum RCEF 264]
MSAVNAHAYPALSAPMNLCISGEYRPSKNSETFAVKNPMTGETLYDCASASIDDYAAAIEEAHAAYLVWSRQGPSARRIVLNKAADILQSYLEKDAPEVLAAEVAATRTWVKQNIFAACGFLRDAASMATHIKGEILPADRPHTTILVNREAVGVVLAVSPWNVPVGLTARAIACALICGNALLLKPSEFSPKSQHLVVRALAEAGLPRGCLQFLPTSPAATPAATAFTIAHPKVSRVNFTGSHRVGNIIAGLCAQAIKPCLLELGGKAAVLVLADADVDAAVDAVAFGAMSNNGQICMSTERAIVHRGLAAEFKAKLVQRVEALRVGNHLEDPEVQLSALCQPAAAARILALIKSAVAAGAQVLTGDQTAHGANKTMLRPHVVAGVTPAMELYQQETFGPVVALTEFDDEEEGIALTNDTEYTLAGSVFSRDVMRAMAVAKRVRVGSCHVNGPTVYVEAPLPNGGIGGHSGYGRFGGMAGVEQFTERKIVTLASPGMQYVV